MILVLSLAVGVYVATAALTDCRMHRIPNYVTVPAAVLGLIYHTVLPEGMGPWMSLAGLGIGFGLLFLPWLLGGSGMGDVKLLAALGAWLGPKWLLVTFALSMMIACVMAMVVLLQGFARWGMGQAKTRFSQTPRGTAGKKEAAKPRRRIVPFALPVALGTGIVLVWLVYKGTL
ncbi:MAG: prepilin peptidase [Pirellulales bacterium]|nr:prepilin peptidase [Pirellulales bacterium]